MTKKNFKKKKEIRLPSKDLQQTILKLFKSDPKKRLNPKQVAKKLQIDNNRDSVQSAMEQLVSSKQLIALGDYKFKISPTAIPAPEKKTVEGVVDITRTGSGFIVCEGMEEDIFVPSKSMGSALNGDRVKIAYWRGRGRRKMEGEVLEVIERATEYFVGTIRISSRYAFVVPDPFKMPVDIFVRLEQINGARDGEKVVVKVVEWQSDKNRNPVGIVTDVLGAAGSSDIEMKSILINNGFQLSFPQSVLDESESLNGEIMEEEVAKRRDFRGVLTFTIDPVDAKDFDDALSFRKLENGNLEVGVHIADVTHFLTPGSALDQEGYKRSTSVYLVDRVLPMLPEKLSNELCSLRPNEDKYTFSAVFEFDENDRVVSRWFGKTLIHSDRRFAYEEAQAIMEKGEGDFFQELGILNRIAKKLRKQRFESGSIDFDADEVRFRLDEHGVPIEVFIKERVDAHMLIEDFMLLANREVATYIHEKGNGEEIPFVYRIHDEPDPAKVAELAAFAKEMGFEMRINSPKDIANSFNRLAEQSKLDPGLRLLEPLAIRTMAKAAYSSDNIGHYGLAFPYYTHFTSPIRRYSDVLVHRVLFENLGEQITRVNKAHLEERCKHISMQERKAMGAERESIKYKQVEFMTKHIGEIFEGRISGIIDRGMFVELIETKCEGLIGFETLGEPFEIEDNRLRVRGLRSKRIIKMGDLIKVLIVDADMGRRQIEMELVE
ncbi:MAG: ribonuclease R [Saprospirales bacterium]|nr:ribonuclease R [Saprospirales bacterium]MBK8491755.1 ribonuclease R [Saprospirales bacterium]